MPVKLTGNQAILCNMYVHVHNCTILSPVVSLPPLSDGPPAGSVRVSHHDPLGSRAAEDWPAPGGGLSLHRGRSGYRSAAGEG